MYKIHTQVINHSTHNEILEKTEYDDSDRETIIDNTIGQSDASIEKGPDDAILNIDRGMYKEIVIITQIG
jgi:hypothetical protein